MIAYYRRRAKGGFGLIIIEVTAIDRKGKAIMNEVDLWDDAYPLLFRFGYDEKVNGGRTLEESVMGGRMAESCGVDALDISIMTYASTPYMSAPPAMPHGFNQFPTKVIEEAVGIPVISVERYEPAIAESALLNGCADFISFGRESIADPDLKNLI